MTAHGLCELGFVESRSGLDLVVPLVTSQCVDLKLEQIHLRHFYIVIGRLSSVVAGLSLAFVANALDEVLVEITDVQMPNALVDVQLQLPLGDALLDALAEGRVPRRAAATLPVLDQTAALAEEGRRGRRVVAVLLRAEPVHDGRFREQLAVKHDAFRRDERESPQSFAKDPATPPKKLQTTEQQ